MTDHDSPHDEVEQYQMTDASGFLFATAAFHPQDDPRTRFEGWVVDFRNGDRLTGDPADEVVKLWMNHVGDTDGLDGGIDGEHQARTDSILETLTFDDDARAWRITVRGVRVWFRSCSAEGTDIVLYQGRDREERAGVLEDTQFSASDVQTAMRLARNGITGGGR